MLRRRELLAGIPLLRRSLAQLLLGQSSDSVWLIRISKERAHAIGS